MANREELDALSSKELHDRAFARAEHHVDVRFFYQLLKQMPAAAAAAGDIDRSNADIFSLRGLISDAVDADEGALADALRPVYIDYLLKHPDA